MRKFFIICSLFFVIPGLSVFAGGEKMNHFYDFQLKDITGEDIKLDAFKGKVILVVNVASKCGSTPQYEGLQKIL